MYTHFALSFKLESDEVDSIAVRRVSHIEYIFVLKYAGFLTILSFKEVQTSNGQRYVGIYNLKLLYVFKIIFRSIQTNSTLIWSGEIYYQYIGDYFAYRPTNYNDNIRLSFLYST